MYLEAIIADSVLQLLDRFVYHPDSRVGLTGSQALEVNAKAAHDCALDLWSCTISPRASKP